MMTMSKRTRQSTIEASEWWIAQREGKLSVEDRARFVAWLRESPSQLAEYLEMANLWEEIGSASARDTTDIEALLAEATNLVHLPQRDTAAIPAKSRRISPPWLRLSTAVSVVIAVILVWWTAAPVDPAPYVVSTAIGEQRSLTLDDGSVISLNTQTALRVRIDADQRHAELLQGEALFDIAHDPSRPFQVITGTTQVQVLGTTFNIYRQDKYTATVTVLEGRVAVLQSEVNSATAKPTQARDTSTTPASAPALKNQPARLELFEGQQAQINRTGLATPISVNPGKAVAWTDRRLVFEDTPLGDVVAEFNRYNTRTLHVEDSTLASLLLNGVFASHDPDSLVQYLQQAKGVSVREVGTQRILEPR